MQTLHQVSTQSLWRVLVVFLFFSLADLFLTFQLIERETSDVIESNPLAATVLTSYGWFGLAGYKMVLVGAFFGLSLVVERRRPIGGLLLMVFACGVHAAVVTSSVFLFLESGRMEDQDQSFAAFVNQQRLQLPTGGLALLIQKPVQDELNLTERQRTQVLEVTKKRRVLSREINLGHLDACQSKLVVITHLEQQFVRELSPSQLNRLGQLSLQRRGILALRDADIMDALELTEAQRDAIHGIAEQRQAPSPRARSFTNSEVLDSDLVSIEMKSRLLNVLTDMQKVRWTAMLGEPIVFRAGKSLN